jgi:uncharacterized glyoxalase superfamily protein PhnB
MKTLSPNFFVDDINATIQFYKLLGFNTIMTVPETGEDLVWVMMNNDSINVMFQTFTSLGEELPQIARTSGGSLLLYIQLTGIRTFFDEIKDKVTLLKGLEKTFYGATEFSILDNNNFVLTFAEDEA